MKKDANYQKSLRAAFIGGMVLSVAFVAGIPMIVLGATNGIVPVMVLGIIMTVAGFYGTPLLWTRYGTLRSYGGLLALITEEGVESVDVMARTLGVPRETALKQLNYLMNKRFLTGYLFDGEDTLTLASAARKANKSGKCPNCGAQLIVTDEGSHCPYCGTRF